MSINNEQYEKIVDFLEDKMSPEERTAFLNEVAADKELHEELEWERVLRNKDDISAEIAKWLIQDEVRPTVPLVKPANSLLHQKRQWLIAASVIGIIVIGATILLFNQKAGRKMVATDKRGDKTTTPDQHAKDTSVSPQAPETDYELAYQKFYRKYRSPADLPSDMENVQLAYEQHDYKRVISEATDISKTRGQDKEDKSVTIYAGLYKGIAFIELNNTQKAIAAFEDAIKKAPRPLLRDELIWYTALCYLKEKKAGQCLNLLNKLTDGGSKKKEALLLKKTINAP